MMYYSDVVPLRRVWQCQPVLGSASFFQSNRVAVRMQYFTCVIGVMNTRATILETDPPRPIEQSAVRMHTRAYTWIIDLFRWRRLTNRTQY
jgi:hypothetical protein